MKCYSFETTQEIWLNIECPAINHSSLSLTYRLKVYDNIANWINLFQHIIITYITPWTSRRLHIEGDS